ncbi:hypothetical protein PPEP_a3728 [Pseudoalteromonas peptidolytica F12-50-A1]|uniref:Uncharacterized protein n=1 Tax=Pseudoalteromonas peptidolytica F12-50-A1 TaxID=1315280 RepID=A0A8I0MV95_9GAMM|nr:hypothetical protein [Pseudoalteromonas peptidolytica F12-50-A1]
MKHNLSRKKLLNGYYHTQKQIDGWKTIKNVTNYKFLWPWIEKVQS